MIGGRLDAVDAGLPRRVSTRPNDPHFDKLACRLSDRIAVLLDGCELEDVASWDVDACEVVRVKLRRDGSVLTDEAGLPTYERLRGIVEVRWAKVTA